MFRSRLLTKGITFLGVAHLIVQLCVWCPNHWRDTEPSRDTGDYYSAARSVALGLTPYHRTINFIPFDSPHGYVYWPLLSIVLAPLTRFGFVAFSRIWYGILLVCFWIFASSLARISAGRTNMRDTLVWGLVLACTPSAYSALSLANADPIMWALAGLAFSTSRFGIFCAIAANIKTYAIWPLILWFRDKRREAISAFVTFAIIVAMSFAVMPNWLPAWAAAIGSFSQGTFHSGNFSIPMTIVKLVYSYHGGALPEWARIVLLTSSVVIELLVIVLSMRLPAPYRYAVLWLGSMLAQPLCWRFYLVAGYVLAAMLIRQKNGSPSPFAIDRHAFRKIGNRNLRTV